jgi:hypothetical protein
LLDGIVKSASRGKNPANTLMAAIFRCCSAKGRRFSMVYFLSPSASARYQ